MVVVAAVGRVVVEVIERNLHLLTGFDPLGSEDMVYDQGSSMVWVLNMKVCFALALEQVLAEDYTSASEVKVVGQRYLHCCIGNLLHFEPESVGYMTTEDSVYS